MITRDTIDKIRDYARVDEVVGEFVTLKRRGSNLIGLCPFHDEKTPSFIVSPAKGIYKCFGCGKSGDSINFIMEHESLPYPEALKFLADKYKIEIEELKLDNEQIQEKSQKDSLYIALNFAAQFYQQQLLETDEGKSVGYSYFKERGFLDETIRQFQLGYSPTGYDTFLKAAEKQGYSKEILQQAGLIGEKEGRYFDFFRERVMFPIQNVSGKVAGFGGRIMVSNPKVGKYVNTPETEVYNKSRILYGIFHSKSEIRKQDVAYMVEGYTDVISLHQAGITNVVASSGTSLTVDQIKLLRRFTENVVILYDGDPAGLKAALRGLDLVLEEGLNVKIVILPEGEDPDSYVRKVGSSEFESYIKKEQKDFIFFKASLLAEEAKNDPVKKTALVRDIVGSISRIRDNIKSAIYISECSRLLDIPENLLIKELNHIRREWVKSKTGHGSEHPDFIPTPEIPIEQASPELNKKLQLETQERDIVRILFQFGDWDFEADKKVADYIFGELGDVGFENANYKQIIIFFRDGLKNGLPYSHVMDFLNFDDPKMKNTIIDLVAFPYEISENWFQKHKIIIKTKEDIFKKDVKSTINRFLFVKIKEIMTQLDEMIREAQQTEDDKWQKLLKKKMDYQKMKDEIAGRLGTVIHP